MALANATGEPENSQVLSTPLPSVSESIVSTILSPLPSTKSAPNFSAKSIRYWLSQSIAITLDAPIALAALTANRPIGPKPCIAIVAPSIGPPVSV